MKALVAFLSLMSISLTSYAHAVSLEGNYTQENDMSAPASCIAMGVCAYPIDNMVSIGKSVELENTFEVEIYTSLGTGENCSFKGAMEVDDQGVLVYKTKENDCRLEISVSDYPADNKSIKVNSYNCERRYCDLAVSLQGTGAGFVKHEAR